jgi:hypothetical protein
MSKNSAIITSVSGRHAKKLFASDLMLGNRKYIKRRVVISTLRGLFMEMLEDFEFGQDENKFDLQCFNTHRVDELNEYVWEHWTERFREPLFIIRDEFIGEGRELDPRVNDHDLSLGNALLDAVKDYLKHADSDTFLRPCTWY